MTAEYFFDVRSSQEVEKAMAKVSDKSEAAVNGVLKSFGVKATIQSIIGFMPISNRKKRHAKTSNSLKGDLGNLSFRVYTRGGAANAKGSFGYLIYPNDGIGPHNHHAQRFFERGGEGASAKIFTNIMTALEDAAKL